MINGGTGLVGLLGHPVKHSLSPVMHNAALQAMERNWRYLALPCSEERLAAVLEGLHAVGCHGLNVTIPHKQTVAALCRDLSPLAQRLGAVNTLIPRDDGGWHGHNTDVEGFLAPLGARDNWAGRHAVVIGYGGSAKAVVAGLQSLNLATITLVGRRATGLDGFLKGMATADAPLRSCLDSDPALTTAIAHADLIVNTTPVGMNQHDEAGAIPLGKELWTQLPTQATLYDLIYTPRPTPWLQYGHGRGHRCIDGLEMLVQQGAASLRLWSHSDTVPVETMRSAAEAALKP
ncbi:shikimate dehydrogenase [Parasynechococcus sp.]|uniref:shikimate dehydrogenase n=1 Tax=Parasynechococcus sp. TaxID=3101203 RepID=UPI003704A6E9